MVPENCGPPFRRERRDTTGTILKTDKDPGNHRWSPRGRPGLAFLYSILLGLQSSGSSVTTVHIVDRLLRAVQNRMKGVRPITGHKEAPGQEAGSRNRPPGRFPWITNHGSPFQLRIDESRSMRPLSCTQHINTHSPNHLVPSAAHVGCFCTLLQKAGN